MTLKKDDILVLLEDVTRDSVERGFTEQYLVVEQPIYYTGKEGNWVTVRLRKLDA